MELSEAAKLQRGDEVLWSDPDDGICTRMLTVQRVTIQGDVVTIHATDGDYLECFAHELS